MTITIIVATFNCAATVGRCLESIRRQDIEKSDLELIVIDGGSSDSTLKEIDAYSADLSYFESSPDRGIAHAWNKGIARMTGDWALFLGADDCLWSPRSLRLMASRLRTTPVDRKVVYGNVVGVRADGERYGLLTRAWNHSRFVHFGYFCHQGVFQHKDLFSEFGLFDESFRYALDYEFLLRYLVDHDAVYIPDVTVTAFQRGGCSNRPEELVRSVRETRLARRKHGIHRDSMLYHRAMLIAFAIGFLIKTGVPPQTIDDALLFLRYGYRRKRGNSPVRCDSRLGTDPIAPIPSGSACRPDAKSSHQPL